MRRMMFGVAMAAAMAWSSATIAAFCGFYVGKADTKLFNRASQVVLVRDGDRTVMTMASDFEGDLKEFAIGIPVPTSLPREQIHGGEKALVDPLDACPAPGLVESSAGDPCDPRRYERAMPMAAASNAGRDATARAKTLGVTIE